jgi:hypothetical protein
VDYCEDTYSAVDGADAVLLATEWEEYYDLDWVLVRESMRGKTVVDGRNVLDGAHLTELGFHYRSFGRPQYNGNGDGTGNGNSNGNGSHRHKNGSTPRIGEASSE